MLSGSDPYFAKDGSFAKKHKTFYASEKLGPHFAEAIHNRSSARVKEFDANIGVLISAFIRSFSAKDKFVEMLKELRAEGLVEMVLRRDEFLHYHIAEHPSEVAYDTGQAVQNIYNGIFVGEDMAHDIFVALAKAAGAWHDVVQNAGPPENEIQSANAFIERLKQKLAVFKDTFKDNAAICNGVEHFEKELDYIGKELIVYNTWLVLGLGANGMVAKTLHERVMDVVHDINTDPERGPSERLHITQGTNHSLRLFMAGDAISQSDTKRFTFDHVNADKVILNAFKKLPMAERSAWEDFFNDEQVVRNKDKNKRIESESEKERFYGLLCQNLRIFGELNRPNLPGVPAMNVTNITPREHQQYTQGLDLARGGSLSSEIDYAQLLTLFFDTKTFNPKEHDPMKALGRDNLAREKSFAQALQNPVWSKYSEQLQVFAEYFRRESLSAEAKQAIAKTIFRLATEFQPGTALLKSDKRFIRQLENMDSTRLITPQAKINIQLARKHYLEPLAPTNKIKQPPSAVERKKLKNRTSYFEFILPTFAKSNKVGPDTSKQEAKSEAKQESKSTGSPKRVAWEDNPDAAQSSRASTILPKIKGLGQKAQSESQLDEKKKTETKIEKGQLIEGKRRITK